MDPMFRAEPDHIMLRIVRMNFYLKDMGFHLAAP